MVVLLGSVGRPLSTAEQQSLGIAGYVTKPIWRARLLHVIAAALDGVPSAPPRTADRSACAPEGAGRRVLLVEDSEINAEVAREILSTAGYTIDLAEDGRKAVEAALARPYDVVLMDCQLPELDGFEATRRIREGELGQARQRAVPIIALTASATKEDHDRCLASGMNDFAAKPLDAARLLRLVAAYAADRAPNLPPFVPHRARFVNLPRALERVQGNAALLRRLAAQLCAIAPTALDELSAAVSARDVEQARFLAHRFGGQAATFDAERIVADLDMLRRAATEARWSDADLLLDELRTSVARMVRELREIAA